MLSWKPLLRTPKKTFSDDFKKFWIEHDVLVKLYGFPTILRKTDSMRLLKKFEEKDINHQFTEEINILYKAIKRHKKIIVW